MVREFSRKIDLMHKNCKKQSGLTGAISVRQGRWINYNFKSEIIGAGSLSAISSIV